MPKNRSIIPALLALALAAGLLIPVTAQAAAPTILSVSQTDGHPAVTWTIPVGGTTETLEIAKAPDVGTDGRFFAENVEAFATFYDSTTTWLDSSQIAPGSYYVHVSGTDPSLDPSCPICAPREYSPVVQLVIPVPVLSTRVAVKAHLDCSTLSISPSLSPTALIGRIKYVLGRTGFRKTLYGRAGSTLSVYVFRLKPGRYTLTAQFAGGSDATVSYTPSNVAVKHFTVKKGC